MVVHADLSDYLAFADIVSANLPILVYFLELKKQVGKTIMMNSLSTDFLIRIKNGYKAGRKTITAPASNFCINIAQILKKYGYLENYKVNDDVKKIITLNLGYNDGIPMVEDVKLFSKPGRRLYEKSSSLPWGKTKQSLIIISTSAGLMSQKEAKVKGVGGEIIAEIY